MNEQREPDFLVEVKVPKKVKRERSVEDARIAIVKRRGGLSRKFVSPGHRGVPDEIELYGVGPMECRLRDELQFHSPAEIKRLARELLAVAIQFTELKRPGKKPTAEQEREHARYRALGFTVNVVDTVEKE